MSSVTGDRSSQVSGAGAAAPRPLPKAALELDPAKATLDDLRAALSTMDEAERRAWVNEPDGRGKTRFAKFVDAGQPPGDARPAEKFKLDKCQMVEHLLKTCRADPNKGDNDNWTPVYRAATKGNEALLGLLLIHGGIESVNVQNVDGSTPLHRLCDEGDQDACELLIKYGAKVDFLNAGGSPLFYTAKKGRKAIAEVLLNQKADVYLVKDPLSITPLAMAIICGKEETAKLLSARGAKEDIPEDSPLHTDLSRLVLKGNDKEILAALGKKDQYGRTVAHYCAAYGRVDLLKLMPRKYLVEPDGENDPKNPALGKTPAHYAIMKGQDAVISYLLSDEVDCDIFATDRQGYGLLMMACQCNRVGIAKQILAKAEKKDKLRDVLHMADKFGWKAMHKAAEVGSVALFSLLLEYKKYGVDPTERNGKGLSCLDLAKKAEVDEMVKFLSQFF